MHAGNFYSHAGYKRAMVMRATKTTMWTQCVNSKAWPGVWHHNWVQQCNG